MDINGVMFGAPPAAGSELDTLTGALDRLRGYVAWKCGSLDMIEEYARHVGHADLIRESVDGLVGEDPPR